ncbi:MAG TPA: Rne/Rng family ribonuclease [Stellaceae bacterium]
MAKRMLIDATHPEETRVVVVSGNRLEEFDFESSTKEQVKGNIYLAKVTRVEPSLQAAFVEYGGNRHGFLAFSEIHPDYYRIPVGDRDAAEDLAAGHEAVAAGQAAAADEALVPLESALPELVVVSETADAGEEEAAEADPAARPGEIGESADGEVAAAAPAGALSTADDAPEGLPLARAAMPLAVPAEERAAVSEPGFLTEPERAVSDDVSAAAWPEISEAEIAAAAPAPHPNGGGEGETAEAAETVETLGGDDLEDTEEPRSHTFRHYKIQEVIKRRQIMLVQVTKEERGNKGAALTTYLSLAGRYCVLMPNTARGGGVSRKITNLGDRRRLKDVLADLEIPDGMGVIVRTAGAERSKAEIKRDYEYLLRLWNEIRELTLRSTAPALIYEEGNLIKRSIRDLYTRDIDEVLVEGEEGYRTAKAFMKMLMPSPAKRVQPYRDPQIGLLHRFQVESQIDAIHSPIVQLRSGGYIVINQTEALVAIDVNSGRSTRERNIEETALRTNLEAAEEIERQLRLRDLAGLIVIDFIDMEEHRNQSAVERRLKEALKHDRARIQVGRISPFGLLEMSRQRLRPSLVEASTQPCPHCAGTGFIRSTESTALHVLRSIEEEGMRRRAAEICIYVPTTVALYILNQKRDSLAQVETRYGVHVLVARDDALIPPAFRLERLRPYGPADATSALPAPLTQSAPEEVPEAVELAEAAEAEVEVAEHEPEEERVRGRRRRRRRRRHEDGEAAASGDAAAAPGARPDSPAIEHESEDDADRQHRRRGRRGGRRRGRRETPAEPVFANPGAAAEQVEIVPTGDDGGEAAWVPEIIAGWPAELAVEIAAEGTAEGLETASVPALAGETALPLEPTGSSSPAGPSREPAAAETIEVARIGGGDEALGNREPDTRPIDTPAADEASAADEPVAAAEPRPDANVQEVTERPANPRRGWWQRLIQP